MRCSNPFAVLSASVVMACMLVSLPAADIAGTWVEMAKRGNVRYGPSTQAPTVTTLSPGTKVLVLGKAPASNGGDWYAIQFPRQGHAWMHSKVLTPTDNPRVLRVTVDKARVRSDSRIRAELIAELKVDEQVEWVGSEIDGKWVGRKVGDWYAVYPPSAVAYCYHSVLRLPQQVRQGMDQKAQEQHPVEVVWQTVRKEYGSFRKALESNQQAGLKQDWAGLSSRLQEVVDSHPRLRTRLDAHRLQVGIKRVLAVAERLKNDSNSSAVVLPDVDQAGSTTKPPVVAQNDPPPVARQDPPQHQPKPQDPPVKEVKPPVQPPVQEPVAAAGKAVEGWLMERDISGVDVRHVLVDQQSSINALIKVKAGVNLPLSEYFWRRVSVTGASTMVTVTIDGKQEQLPLLTITAIRMR